MLDKNSYRLTHALQNTLLLALSAVTLPVSLCILIASYLYPGQQPVVLEDGPRKTILVTGVGMTKGLTLARHFHLAGFRVIGADFSSFSSGRFSKSLSAFYVPNKPTTGKAGSAHYILDLIRIINLEQVDLWVSCSGVASAISDGEAKEAIESATECKCIQFDIQQTETLHEKHNFIAHVRDLGLTIPETHVIKDRAEALRLLTTSAGSGKGPSRNYILKPIGMDDSSRGDINTLLPRPTAAETQSHLQTLDISPANPFILQQHIKGAEYCTHALVIRGIVKAFVACPSSDMLMHYECLAPTSALSLAMLAFTRRIAENGGEGFTGHLSFDFLVEGSSAEWVDGKPVLYPIECNPRAHTAVALFRGAEGEMVGAYLSALHSELGDEMGGGGVGGSIVKGGSDGGDGMGGGGVVYPRSEEIKVYWVGHDLVTRAILPLWHLLLGSVSSSTAKARLQEFVHHILYWQDGTYERWDPVPAFVLYHVEWPMRFLGCLAGLLLLRKGEGSSKWSRVNVSTGKVFGC